MSQQREIINPEELLQRGFVRDPDQLPFPWNEVNMKRQIAEDLELQVWHRTAAESFHIQINNPSDFDSVCELMHVKTIPEALPLIDALIAAFTPQSTGLAGTDSKGTPDANKQG